jgi:hypothetical protein
MVVIIFAFAQEDDTKVKKILTIANIFWLGHFLFMWLYIWVAMVIISSIRLYLSIKFEKNRKIFYIVTGVTIVTGIFSYTEPSSLYPILASMFATYAFFFLEKVKLRLVLLVCSSFWLSFHYLHFSIGGMITESIIHVVHLMTIYKILSHEGHLSGYMDRIKHIFVRKPNIDYGRYLAVIDFIHRKK